MAKFDPAWAGRNREMTVLAVSQSAVAAALCRRTPYERRALWTAGAERSVDPALAARWKRIGPATIRPGQFGIVGFYLIGGGPRPDKLRLDHIEARRSSSSVRFCSLLGRTLSVTPRCS